ncbi:MAG: signal recognition particle protein [Nitrospirota bacterium]|nr:signal recognition particle protein [Nitrospirota bacterium]
MLEDLSGKLQAIFKKLSGRGLLTEEVVAESLREVRLALLEADVNFRVVKDLVEKIRVRAVGQEVLGSITPGQQVIKIVHDELCAMMGGQATGIPLVPNQPTVIMMVGLQGSGKTTTTAKLALRFKKDGRRVLMVAADTQRPAAIRQLFTLGEQTGVEVYGTQEKDDPVRVCREGFDKAYRAGFDVVLFDTAGRLQIDETLMEELAQIKGVVKPHEILLVADAMTGQEAVNIATRFNEVLDLSGVVLTKLDGDARGGAALSIRAVTGKPIKFAGIGEKIEAIELFHPDRLASRILGMGDVLSLIEKAQTAVTVQDAAALQEKLAKDGFTLEDFREQITQMKKLGSLKDLMGMLPGMGKLNMANMKVDDREVARVEAIINSMTRKERLNPVIINGSRRVRISKGSGTTVQEVNRLLKQFAEARKMFKTLSSAKGKKGLASMARRLMPF